MVSTRDHAISKHKSFKDSISCCLLSLYFFRWFCDVVFAHPLHQDFSLEELEKPFGNLMGTWWEHIENKGKKKCPSFAHSHPKTQKKKSKAPSCMLRLLIDHMRENSKSVYHHFQRIHSFQKRMRFEGNRRKLFVLSERKKSCNENNQIVH